MARMSIDDSFGRDPRVIRLSKLCQWSRRETMGALLDVFALCYDRVSEYLPEEDIDTTAEYPSFTQKMIAVDLATVFRSNMMRIRGAKDRIKYLRGLKESGRVGGLMSAEKRRKEGKGKSRVASPPPQGSLQLPSSDASSDAWQPPQATMNPPDTVPDPVPEYRAREDLGPRLVLVSPELPEYGGRADLEQGVVCQPVTPEPGRGRKPSTGSRNPAGDPRAAERSRLLRKLMGLHVKAFNVLREEFGLQVPAMQPVGDPTERALRELIDDQATLAGFEDSALHVLAVRESEVRRMRPPSLRYFGPTVWQPTAFATARTMEVGEDRSAPARDVRYGRAEPSSADVHARDALKGDRF